MGGVVHALWSVEGLCADSLVRPIGGGLPAGEELRQAMDGGRDLRLSVRWSLWRPVTRQWPACAAQRRSGRCFSPASLVRIATTRVLDSSAAGFAGDVAREPEHREACAKGVQELAGWIALVRPAGRRRPGAVGPRPGD